MHSRAAALALSVLFKVAFFAFILSSSYSSADVTGFFAIAFPFFSFVFMLFFLGITVALATGSKPGISPHPVPSELKSDGGGEDESVRVHVHSRGECAPLVVDPNAKPAAFHLGGGAGRSASESSSA